MHVLFTKKLNSALVSKNLETEISYNFCEVIKTIPRTLEPFHLGGHSLIFTSISAVDSFFANGFVPNENFRDKDFNKIYAVGLKTKKELRKHGYGTFKVVRNGATLSDFILKNSAYEKFLHFCGNLALDVLDKSLPLQNIFYKKIPVYDTVLLYPKITDNYDAVCFFSPSGVRSFAKFNSFEGKKIFSIGETTTAEIRKFTQEKIFTSERNTLEDLLGILVRNLNN